MSSEPILHAAAPDVATREKLEGGHRLVMHTDFKPAGDQPTAIKELAGGINDGEQNQVLLAVIDAACQLLDGRWLVASGLEVGVHHKAVSAFEFLACGDIGSGGVKNRV